MIKTDLKIKELFRDSEELLLIIAPDRGIAHINPKGVSTLGKVSSVTEIEHLFSFEVCLLDNSNIFNYNPLSEAILSPEPLKSEVLLQITENRYKKLRLRSFKEGQNTIIILSDISDAGSEERVAELERENREFMQVREQAQNLAIRTGLINRISNSIRESLSLEEIINVILSETTATLGLARGEFKYADEMDAQDDFGVKIVMTDKTTGFTQPRLVTPVIYRNKLLGALIFYHLNNKKSWNEEEISLIEGIASQLASAINQARAQAQLVQSEKMASLGQLVAGVAHEINTPLGSINSSNNIFSRCIEKISGPDSVLDILRSAIITNAEAVRRINSLVKSLRNFARLDRAEFQETNLHEGLKNTLMLLSHETKGRIEVIEDFRDIPAVKCYPDQLNQVFMNILINACQSIEGQGRITIKTEKITDNVVITISDTGKGISRDNLKKIFDPGFTTKSVGVGTGLGLAICYRIIEEHRGGISVESEEGKGSTFRIELPVQWELV